MTGLPSIWHASSQHIGHTVWVSNKFVPDGTSLLMYPEPALRTHNGNQASSQRRSSPDSEILSFVFFMLTLRPLPSMSSFQVISLAMQSSSKSAIIAKSSAYRSSHGSQVWNSHYSASSTRIKSRGLRAESWCTPTPTSKPLAVLPFLGSLSKAFSRSTKARYSGLFAAMYFSSNWSWWKWHK